MGFAIAVAVVGLLALILTTWNSEIPLLWAKEGFQPKPLHVGLVAGLVTALIVLIALLAATLDTVKAEHAVHVAQVREAAKPPPVLPESPQQSPLQATIKSYELQRFAFQMQPEFEGAPQLWAGPIQPDVEGVFRRAGALIYPDGSATQFSIAVIYQTSLWQVGNAERVRESSKARSVLIHTALGRPMVRELIDANDYVLGLGLASSKAQEENRNEKLAIARARNLSIAIVHKLKLKKADQMLGASLGYALEPPTVETFEPRQRAVVVVGINASREVNVGHVVMGVTHLVVVKGVDLRKYQHSNGYIIQTANVADLVDYQTVDDIDDDVVESQGAWIEPAIKR